MLCIFSLLSLKIIIIIPKQNGGGEREGERHREREKERGMLLSRAAQQFSSSTMNLDGQISRGVLSCSERQAAYCKHMRANACSCARFYFSSSLNKPVSLCFHISLHTHCFIYNVSTYNFNSFNRFIIQEMSDLLYCNFCHNKLVCQA